MAGPGASQGFDSGAFRDAVTFAMTMSAPSDVNQQVTFIIEDQATFNPEDTNDDPYDWTATPTSDVPQKTVVVPAAVTFGTAGTVEGEPVGEFDAMKVTLTLLDVDQAQVVGATLVLVGGVHYVIDPPGAIPEGLFDVTIYTYRLTARG